MKKKVKYCTLLLIDDDKNCKMFISELNKYYIKGRNKIIHIKILDKFRGINKSHKINVIGTADNYYKNDKYFAIKNCTIILIDDNDHSKIFISEKNSYFISKDCDYDNYDYCDYYYDDDYNCYDDNNDDYYDYDYYNCNYVDDNDDYNYHDDDNDYLYYKKPFNYFERLISVKNNTVNWINNIDYNHEITLLVSNHKICIC